MEENYDVENEEIINIPKIMSLSDLLSEEKKLKLNKQKTRNLSISSVNSFLSYNDLNDNEKFNKNDIIDKNIRNRHSNSITSRSSLDEKNKKVTFTNVEVIRVKNYKRYNKLNTSKKNEEEEIKNNNSSDFNCILF